MTPDDETLLRRALAAYYRAAKKVHPSAQPLQPSRDSGVVQLNSKTFVHFFNVNGTLAVYELLTNGRIKAVPAPDWPAVLA